MLQVFDNEILFTNDELNQIANGDNTNQLIIIEYG